MKKTYVAVARRSGRWWAIDVPEVAGVFSQARRLADVAPMAREAIALMLDVSPRSFDVVVRPILPSSLEMIVQEARQARVNAQEMQLEAGQRSARALRALERADMPLRDAGELLGISHQRAAQIAKADRRGYDQQRRRAIAELRSGYDLGGGPLPRRQDVYDG